MKFENFDFKKAGIWGIIVYVLSLPIMIWKSSHVGRAIGMWLMILVAVYSIVNVGNAALGLWVKYTIVSKSNEMLKQIDEVNKEVLIHKSEIVSWAKSKNSDIKEKIESEINKNISDKIIQLSDELQIIDQSISLIKEQERQSLKEVIWDLREKIKIQKQNIATKEIQKMVDQIAQNIKLLSDADRDRLLKDLDEFGFETNNTKNGGVEIITYNGQDGTTTRNRRVYSMSTTASTVGWYIN